MEKQYDSFKLVEGNIADFKGGAVVVPCWTNLHTSNVISHAIYRKLEDLGFELSENSMFEPNNIYRGKKLKEVKSKPIDLNNIIVGPHAVYTPRDISNEPVTVPSLSAHYYGNCELPDVKGFILAACYVDTGEPDAQFNVRAAKTTANVLDLAYEKNIESIAFPALMAGRQGGSLDDIIPAMINEFKRHLSEKPLPKDISSYIFGPTAFNAARQIADSIT